MMNHTTSTDGVNDEQIKIAFGLIFFLNGEVVEEKKRK